MTAQIFFPTSSSEVVENKNNSRSLFGDRRLQKRYIELRDLMSSQQSLVVHQVTNNTSGRIAYYNFLNNKNINLGELIDVSCHFDEDLVRDKDLLVFLDTTAIGLSMQLKNASKWRNVTGVLEDNKTPGFFLHSALVYSPIDSAIVGLGELVLYSNPPLYGTEEEKNKIRADRRKLDITQKDSYVWSLAAMNTKKRYHMSKHMTFIMDAGGDRYESISLLLEKSYGDMIVRLKGPRRIINMQTNEEGMSSEILNHNFLYSRYVWLRSQDHYSKSKGKRVQRQGRQALLNMRYLSEIYLQEPTNYQKNRVTTEHLFSLIEVIEDATTVPKGEEAIHWLLLTSHKITTPEMAWKIVDNYRARWNIEQLFRVMKSQGLDVQNSQLKNIDAIKRQTIMAADIATMAMKLTLAREGKEEIPIETMFDSEQEEALEKLNPTMEGRTEALKNPHKKRTLAWAAWVVARLGGWSGYQSQRKPGPITMKRGLEKFFDFLWAKRLLEQS